MLPPLSEDNKTRRVNSQQLLEVLAAALSVSQGGAPPASTELERLTELVKAAGERFEGTKVREAVEKILLAPQLDVGLELLRQTGALALILPEVFATVDFVQEMGRRHKDVWKHTKQVIAQCVSIPVVRWAALLHDVGKVPTRELTPEGKVTFHGHAEVGARMFEAAARRLDFPRPEKVKIKFLILHHLRANQYESSWTDSAVRRFDREMGEHLDDLIALSRADITSAQKHKRENAARQIEELLRRLRELREQDSRIPPLPSGLGNAIMEEFQLTAGPQIGQLRRLLEEAVEQGKLDAQRDASYYLDYLRQRRPSND